MCHRKGPPEYARKPAVENVMDAPLTTALTNLRVKPLVACLLLPLTVGNLACTSAAAAAIPVTNCNDAGSGSLREALSLAHSGDGVNLTGLACSTISLSTGELLVSVDDLALQGPGANALTISGNQAISHHFYSVIHHTGHGELRVEALKVTDKNAAYSGYNSVHARCIQSTGNVYLNRATVTDCGGGGVSANAFSARDSTISGSLQGVLTSGGSVSITGSTISGNGNGNGYCAALRIDHPVDSPPATALISNSTISGNQSYNYAGCINGLATIIRNSTVAFNTTYYSRVPVGGLKISVPQLTIESSIFANNGRYNYTPDSGAFDLFFPTVQQIDGHNNLITLVLTSTALPADTISTDPRLMPLSDNGGPTQTHALAAGSPAIDAGNNLAGLATDQRGSGFLRSGGLRADIGAFESQAPAVNEGAIGPGFTGSWFDPAQSGHGLMLEVLSDHRLLAMWFAFNPAGNQQAWFGGVGTYSGNTATIIGAALPTGGRWIPNFDQNSIVQHPWGTLVFTFTDCNHGKVDFNSGLGYGNGSMNLFRLTQPAGLACP
jgi:hypothetical protein